MSDPLVPKSESLPQDAENFGKVPNGAEGFGNVPKSSEAFGKVPNDSETFRTVPKGAERTEHHTLTVREVARLFEQAGVPRTERSIVNWCQPNHQGIARLDAFFDTNERKYFVTQQSVIAAIREEQAKQTGVGAAEAPANAVPKPSEPTRSSAGDAASLEAMRAKIQDLEITNRVKDQVIQAFRKDREEMAIDRENYVSKLMGQSHRIGQLEAQLLQLGAPANDSKPNMADTFGNLSNHKRSEAQGSTPLPRDGSIIERFPG